jgi:hypothetical protein
MNVFKHLLEKQEGMLLRSLVTGNQCFPCKELRITNENLSLLRQNTLLCKGVRNLTFESGEKRLKGTQETAQEEKLKSSWTQANSSEIRGSNIHNKTIQMVRMAGYYENRQFWNMLRQCE